MGITLKNLRPGVLILADARLRLGPGETAEVASLTPQIQKALSAGLLARLDEGDEGDVTGNQAADPAPPSVVETSAERAASGNEGENAGRRGQGGKRPSLDALRTKAEEAAGGAG